jgi:transposase InsO family protein
VWAADITYIAMQQGFLYLVAIIDWATRRVLSWRLSNTLTAGFCVEALSEALARFGTPGIFNTDQSLPSRKRGGAIHQRGVHQGADGSRDRDQHGCPTRSTQIQKYRLSPSLRRAPSWTKRPGLLVLVNASALTGGGSSSS